MPEIERGGDTVTGVEDEILWLGLAFADEGLDVVTAKLAAAEAELDDEIGEAERGIALRRAVEAVVEVESGLSVMVGMVKGAGIPTARWWLTVELRGAAPGGVGVGVRGFLHGEAIATKDETLTGTMKVSKCLVCECGLGFVCVFLGFSALSALVFVLVVVVSLTH